MLVSAALTSGVAVYRACQGAVPGLPGAHALRRVLAKRTVGNMISTNGQLMSYPDVLDLRTTLGPDAPLSAVARADGVLDTRDGPVSLDGLLVSDNFATLTELPIVRGRMWSAAPAAGDAAWPIVLTWATWARQFGGNPAIIGTELQLNGAAWRVVGITDPSFTQLRSSPVDFIAPIEGVDRLRGGGGWLTSRRSAWVEAAARPTAGGLSPAIAERMAVFRSAAFEMGVDPRPRVSLVPWQRCVGDLALTPDRQQTAAFVAALLLLALATMLSSWTSGGARPRAIPITAVIALGAAVAATATVIAETDARRGWSGRPAPLSHSGATDLLSGAAMCVLAAVLAAILLHALHIVVARRDATPAALPAPDLGTTAGRAHRAWWLDVVASTCIGAVAALGVIAVTGVVTADSQRLGMDLDHVAVSAAVRATTPADEPRARELLATLRATPGVEALAVAEQVPFVSVGGASIRRADGPRRPAPKVGPYLNRVSERYFAVVGIPIVRGRAFAPAETEADHTVIVSEAFARHYFGGEDPVGQCLVSGPRGAPRTCLEVVGVARDARYLRVDEPPIPSVYVPLALDAASVARGSILLRTRTQSDDFLAASHRELTARMRAAWPGATVMFQPLAAQLLAQRAPLQSAWIAFRNVAIGALLLFAVIVSTEVRRHAARAAAEPLVRGATPEDTEAEGDADADAGAWWGHPALSRVAIVAGGVLVGTLIARTGAQHWLYGRAEAVTSLAPLASVGALAVLGAITWYLTRRASAGMTEAHG